MTATRSWHIEAPVDTVFDFFKDPSKWQDVSMMDMHDVNVTKDGTGTNYSWRFKIAGLPVEGFDVFTEVEPNHHIREKSSRGFVGTWDYTFEPEGTGTKLTIDVHPESFWRLPPLRIPLELGVSRMGDMFMPKLKAKIEDSVSTTKTTVQSSLSTPKATVGGSISTPQPPTG